MPSTISKLRYGKAERLFLRKVIDEGYTKSDAYNLVRKRFGDRMATILEKNVEEYINRK